MRLVPLAGPGAPAIGGAGGPGADDGVPGIGDIGFKAARLAAALRAGLPVLPGWVVPVGLGESAMGAGS